MMDPTRELLRRAEQADGAAIDALLECHREPVRRAIAARIDPAIAARVDASDVVQEVLLEASRRLREYFKNPAMPFHLWLRQIARDRLIDAHRRHHAAERRTVRREQPIAPQPFSDRSSIELAADVRDRELTPAAAAMRQELTRRFQAAIGQLDDEDREIVLMRYFEQLSNQESAQVLGLSEPAAGMRHLRALRRLRTLLGEGPSQVERR
jgi:RNA polymerase sigma-70 factor (ECF subfamily)